MNRAAFTRVSAARTSGSPAWLLLSPALLLPLALNGPNTMIALFAVVVLVVGLGLLWRPGEPPILMFIFLYQWIQSGTGALYGNATGVPIQYLTLYSGDHELASYLMLTGTLAMAVGMRAAAGKPLLQARSRLKALADARTFGFWLRVYAAAWIFSAVCQTIAPMAGGLRQPFVTMSGIKWAAFVLFTFMAFSSSSSSARRIWTGIFVFEFILSIGGFFASFKDVFFFALFGLVASNIRFGLRVIIPGALLAVAMLGLGLVWTAIKGDYRSFASAGTGQQVVLVDVGERISELGRLIGRLDAQALEAATDDFISRLMYHQFLGAVVVNVPSRLPHADGEIWGEAVSRPFMPRLLFPDKSAIDDSELTNRYTGLNVAGVDEGTQISIGFMGEAYIDFGPVLMFGALAALGAGIGLFYAWLMRQPGPKAVIGAALAPFALMPAHLAETSILKMVPGLILTFLACIVVLRCLAPLVVGRLDRNRARRP